VGKAGKRNTPKNILRASIEPALEEARKLLRLLYPEGFWLGHSNLRHYLLPLLDEMPATPLTTIGRPSNPGRDAAIVAVLARLVVKYEIPLMCSRRGPHRRLSACAIVAQALGEIGIHLNEAGVEAVWSKRRPQLSPHEIDARSLLPRTIELD
jgi:hypothetical protein